MSSDVNKVLGLEANAKDLDPKAKDLSHKATAKDLRYQGQIFHRSSLCIIFHC